MENKELMVNICCTAYNQEKYIRKCLDGFVMQQTNFRFEAIVHDDASTDKTADIILEYAKKYPHIIKPIIEKENQYSKKDGSLRRIMSEACTGKYIAYCEGDDYWTDPLKLQKQVDFLEQHPDYSMSHTAYLNYDEAKDVYYEGSEIEKINSQLVGHYEPVDVISHGTIIQTLTVLVRREYREKAFASEPFLFSGYFLMGDTQLWYLISKMGKIHYLSDRTAVYNRISGSVTHSTDIKKEWRFYLSVAEMHMYIVKMDNIIGPFKDETEEAYNKVLLEYILLDKSFKSPLYPLDLSKMDIATRLFYPLGLLGKWRGVVGLWNKITKRNQ